MRVIFSVFTHVFLLFCHFFSFNKVKENGLKVYKLMAWASIEITAGTTMVAAPYHCRMYLLRLDAVTVSLFGLAHFFKLENEIFILTRVYAPTKKKSLFFNGEIANSWPFDGAQNKKSLWVKEKWECNSDSEKTSIERNKDNKENE